jgi:polysaccharide export outer membrane protein
MNIFAGMGSLKPFVCLKKSLILLLMLCALGATASAVDSIADYRLAAGDKVKIHVFGEDNMDVDTRLGISGDIRYPFLGKIHVAGMTLAELEQYITSKLADGYLVNPQVRVSMEEFRPFYVNGEVQKPGGYPYQPGLNVRKAISLAGGFAENADENKIFLIRAGQVRKEGEATSLDAEVGPGDIITVKKSFFFVTGEVEHAGKFPYKEGITFRMAISTAGGLTERGDEDKVYVTHGDGDRKMKKVENLDKAVKAGDVITVRQSFF